MKKDVIAIVHNIIQPGISEAEVEGFLAEHFSGMQWEIITFQPTVIRKGESSIDWKAIKSKQWEMFEEFRKNYLNGTQDPKIIYFGYAPIPLMMHLGHLFTAYPKILLADKHRSRNRWEMFGEGEATQPSFWKLDAPQKPQVSGTAKEEAIFRVQTSKFELQEHSCREVVPQYHKQAWLHGEDTLQDPFITRGDIQEVGELFARGLERLKEASEHLERIHVFASVQPPVAFLMGQKIYESHPPVVCYNFAGGKYQEAFLVNKDDYALSELDDHELEATTQLRQSFAHHFEQELKPFLNSKMGKDKWYLEALGTTVEMLQEYPALNNLRSLSEDNLAKAKVLTDPSQFEGSAVLTRGRFQLSDHLLHSLLTRLHSESDRLSALRMLVFHEWLHQHQHKLQDKIARGIGKFPKILEELDYQADVYAILNEVGYLLSLPIHKDARNDKLKKGELIKRCMRVAIETYWAFHALDPDPGQMEVRHIHRHLIWAVQWLKCDRLPELDTVAIMKVLAHRPLLEMEGFEVLANHEQRMMVNLRANLGKPVRTAMYLPQENRLRIAEAEEFKEIISALLGKDTQGVREVAEHFLQRIE
jgi:hypothetical protein